MNRNGSRATHDSPWPRIKALISPSGRAKYGVYNDLSRATGYSVVKLRGAIQKGLRPHDGPAMVVAIAKFLKVDALDLLDPRRNGPPRKAGDVKRRIAEMAGPKARHTMWCLERPRARAALEREARRIRARLG